ncbi:hypothetical protein HDU98_002902 [Podochytrium sp. JEL0797]|nr:hypothetical protein HDU98_002902 [Podochytrium sp. JEL0797]
MERNTFAQAARSFATLHNKTPGNESLQFEYREALPTPYLVLTTRFPRSPHTPPLPTDDLTYPSFEEPTDPASIPESADTPFTNDATLELHIVYSPTYHVPLLLFNAWDRSGAVIPYSEVIEASVFTGSQRDEFMGPVIAQQDHPILCMPFHALHPCNTVKILMEMKDASATCSWTGDGVVHWITSWWSVVRLVFGRSIDVGQFPEIPNPIQ